ncbi:MAG: pteridine reductase [Pseudomonadota bacterium]|nr:pteridine reductase [Pseudomonadota bacterium]
MALEHTTLAGKTALITAGTRRIGAAIARRLHAAGMQLVLHHRGRPEEARQLEDELLGRRPDSVLLVQGDLLHTGWLPELVAQAAGRWGRLDLLVNNASSFYPTPLAAASEAQWEDLLGSNVKAPFFLAQAAAPHLARTGGGIVNIVDIHARRPLRRHSVYCIAKAGLAMLTRALALELAPAVRVNGVAPGAILWPERGVSDAHKARVLARIPLGRTGDPDDVARLVQFLAGEGGYVTGQILTVDGGRSLFM